MPDSLTINARLSRKDQWERDEKARRQACARDRASNDVT